MAVALLNLKVIGIRRPGESPCCCLFRRGYDIEMESDGCKGNNLRLDRRTKNRGWRPQSLESDLAAKGPCWSCFQELIVDTNLNSLSLCVTRARIRAMAYYSRTCHSGLYIFCRVLAPNGTTEQKTLHSGFIFCSQEF